MAESSISAGVGLDDTVGKQEQTGFLTAVAAMAFLDIRQFL
jgi:hypothetical protein